MEPRPVIDDVFGDPAEYRRTIDRFLALGEGMQRTRDQFARAVQAALAEVQAHADRSQRAKKCPEGEVAKPYARALALGQRYLLTGRELARRHEQLREFDRLGETVGLTPDYRATAISEAKANSSKLTLVSSTIPVVSLVLGAISLLVGILLVRRSSTEDAPTTT